MPDKRCQLSCSRAAISKGLPGSFTVDAFPRSLTGGARLVRECVAKAVALGALAVACFFAKPALAAREQAEQAVNHRFTSGFVRHWVYSVWCDLISGFSMWRQTGGFK